MTFRTYKDQGIELVSAYSRHAHVSGFVSYAASLRTCCWSTSRPIPCAISGCDLPSPANPPTSSLESLGSPSRHSGALSITMVFGSQMSCSVGSTLPTPSTW